MDCGADLQLQSLHDLERWMPWLWGPEGDERGKGDELPGGGVLGTAVYVQA